ncbi:MAG: alpha/beta hydrolase, partial [Mycobacterium sp.]|nr:alpha/beta hydrolase [Mycobacterium sp.]
MDFVLVHGTTQSPAGWERLVAGLARRGHRGVTVDLCADEPIFDVDDYARLAAAQVPACNGPVVVAHSGSGTLLPAIAEALDAAAMVWLAAYVPDFIDGRSLLDEIRTHPKRLFHADWLGVDPAADTSAATEFLFHDCDPQLQQWALTTLH